MKQILVQLDDRIAAELEAVAPGSSRKRSEFIRQAISRALLEVTELRTRARYAAHPQEPSRFDPGAWAPPAEALRKPKRRRRART